MGTRITRGSTIVFTTVFLNVDGVAVSPASATLYVQYRRAGVMTLETIPLAIVMSSWTASWDSALADVGQAFWHIRSAGSNKSATEGTLDLLANPSNPVT